VKWKTTHKCDIILRKRGNVDMEIFSHIISNPLYSLIFGSGGVAIIFFTILGLKKKDKNINIKIDVNGNRKKDEEAKKDTNYNLEFESNPIIDKHEEYEKLDFNSDEYYITFLKTIEEKKKGGDEFEYK
jgi:hypothetical protein